MFGIPIEVIDFPWIDQFCRTYPEGVRVEYKREPTHIAKVVSSFANTAGGIWIIGVEADPVNNMPRLPVEGMLRRAGVQEQIVQACYSGIYPTLTPALRVIDVPGRSDRIVVVVKASESLEAPHAIENSTRVYVRVASTTQPYELADIDRIAYLLKRREQPERRREELIALLSGRSPGIARLRLRIIVCPVYPRGPLGTPEDLYARAQALQEDPRHPASPYFRAVRRVDQGILSSRLTTAELPHHIEANIAGVILYETNLQPQIQDLGAGNRREHCKLFDFVQPIQRVLQIADYLLPKDAITNMLARVELSDARGLCYHPHVGEGRSFPDLDQILRNCVCVNDSIRAETYFIRECIQQEMVSIITDLVRQILWPFNFTEDDLKGKVQQLLR